jgi:tetratricopeptide (TPR) repeat protein
MAPELEEACTAARAGRPAPRTVDRRADIFSLGRLLYVTLAGDIPAAGPGHVPLFHLNPQVSVGLSDMVDRCLACNPDQRYAEAAALATDLRCHLAHLPLRGVSNRSIPERWRKWHRRRPHALLWMCLALALTTATAFLIGKTIDRYHDAQSALTDGQAQMNRAAYQEAVHTLVRGKAQTVRLPGSDSLVKAIDATLRQAQRAGAAQDLHTVAESLRFLAGADLHSIQQMQRLQDSCRTVWEARALLCDQQQAPLGADTDQLIRADLLDLVLLWTDLQRRCLQGAESDELRQRCQALLAEAEELLGSSVALAGERHRLARGTTRDGIPAPALPARASWDHVVLGRSLLRAGELERAEEELERAAELRPQDFWANFYRGVCAYRRQRFDEAVHSFGVAIALSPRSAECYYNRALVYSASGKNLHARRDYDRALELDPHLGVALLNRGVLHYQEGRFLQARTDLKQALCNGADPAAACYNLALVNLAEHDLEAARQHVEQALRLNPDRVDAQALRNHLLQGR